MIETHIFYWKINYNFIIKKEVKKQVSAYSGELFLDSSLHPTLVKLNQVLSISNLTTVKFEKKKINTTKLNDIR